MQCAGLLQRGRGSHVLPACALPGAFRGGGGGAGSVRVYRVRSTKAMRGPNSCAVMCSGGGGGGA